MAFKLGKGHEEPHAHGLVHTHSKRASSIYTRTHIHTHTAFIIQHKRRVAVKKTKAYGGGECVSVYSMKGLRVTAKVYIKHIFFYS